MKCSDTACSRFSTFLLNPFVTHPDAAAFRPPDGLRQHHGVGYARGLLPWSANRRAGLCLDAGTAFNRQLFDNRKLWLALAAVLVLQVVVVNWGPAQAIFDTESLNLGDWLLATGIAASVLLLDEARKLAVHCWRMIGDRKALHGVAADR